MSAMVHGIVVTHQPHTELRAVIERCAGEVSTLHVVDNGSGSGAPAEIVSGVANATLIKNAENVGIAAALNAGVRRALSGGAEWVLTMDHDTLLPSGFVAEMLAQHTDPASRVGILAPTYAIRGRPSPVAGTARRLSDAVITSANLVRADVFRDAGLYDESFFIDYVDFEFCLRARRAGFQIVELPTPVVDHRLGEVRYANLMGARIRHTHYDHRRRYLKARNRVRTYRRHAASFPWWTLRDVVGLPWELVSAAVFEDERVKAVRVMLSGVFDALREPLPAEPLPLGNGAIAK